MQETEGHFLESVQGNGANRQAKRGGKEESSGLEKVLSNISFS